MSFYVNCHIPPIVLQLSSIMKISCAMWFLQVSEPLRAMVMGAPLEDARHLTQRYERLRQEAEAQVCKKDYPIYKLRYRIFVKTIFFLY